MQDLVNDDGTDGDHLTPSLDGGEDEGIYMSEYDKKSLRLMGLLLLTTIILLVLAWRWSRELCRRKLGFGRKVFSARRNKPQSWKKLK